MLPRQLEDLLMPALNATYDNRIGEEKREGRKDASHMDERERKDERERDRRKNERKDERKARTRGRQGTRRGGRKNEKGRKKE